VDRGSIAPCAQGADLGSTTGCAGAPSFSLSEEIIVTIL
jgi:hypothetical protein